VGPLRRIIWGRVGRQEHGSHDQAPPRPRQSSPLENYVRRMAEFANVPEEQVWRSAQVREYARKFGMEGELNERLRGM